MATSGSGSSSSSGTFGILATLTQVESNTFVTQSWLEFPTTLVGLDGRVFGGEYELRFTVLDKGRVVERHALPLTLHQKPGWRLRVDLEAV